VSAIAILKLQKNHDMTKFTVLRASFGVRSGDDCW